MASRFPDDYEEPFGSISTFYPRLSSILSPILCFTPISAFYPHFSVLSPFQCFISISAFYPHFSVSSPFQFPFSVSVSAIHFQYFILISVSVFRFRFSHSVSAFYLGPLCLLLSHIFYCILKTHDSDNFF